MVTLRVATCEDMEAPLHAAEQGDPLTICGHPVDRLLEVAWDADCVEACPRCALAIEVLRESSAV